MRPKQKDKLADFFYKLAEYTFIGLVIGAIVSRPAGYQNLLMFGTVGTFSFAIVSFYLDGLKERRK